MTTIDLYEILNVKPDCELADIKNSYRDFAKKFHPDKGGDKELFDLGTYAYEILKNEDSRNQYNEICKISKQSERDFVKMKATFDAFIDAQNASIDLTDEKTLQIANENFKQSWQELNKKHNYIEEEAKVAMKPEDATQILTDLLLSREQEDIENTHENIFEGKEFDSKKFNSFFDSKKNKQHNNQLVTDSNLSAWNNSSKNFTQLDEANNLYDDDTSTLNGGAYGSRFGLVDDIGNLPSANADFQNELIKDGNYYDNHNYKESNYEQTLEERMRERELETNNLQNMGFDDFQTENKDFRFLHEIGYTGATSGLLYSEDDIKDKYNKFFGDGKNLQMQYDKLLLEKNNNNNNVSDNINNAINDMVETHETIEIIEITDTNDVTY